MLPAAPPDALELPLEEPPSAEPEPPGAEAWLKAVNRSSRNVPRSLRIVESDAGAELAEEPLPAELAWLLFELVLAPPAEPEAPLELVEAEARAPEAEVEADEAVAGAPPE